MNAKSHSTALFCIRAVFQLLRTDDSLLNCPITFRNFSYVIITRFCTMNLAELNYFVRLNARGIVKKKKKSRKRGKSHYKIKIGITRKVYVYISTNILHLVCVN